MFTCGGTLSSEERADATRLGFPRSQLAVCAIFGGPLGATEGGWQANEAEAQ
jgi:hypothetical protein